MKKILQRCDPTPHFTVEKTGQKAPWIPGRALRTDDCFTVTLMKCLCLFRKPSCFLLSIKRFSELFLPQTEHTQLGAHVSLAASARPSPPYDPEKGTFLGPVGCYGLSFPAKLCKTTPDGKEHPSSYCDCFLTLNHSGCREVGAVVGGAGGGAWLAIKLMQHFLEFLFVHLTK